MKPWRRPRLQTTQTKTQALKTQTQTLGGVISRTPTHGLIKPGEHHCPHERTRSNNNRA